MPASNLQGLNIVHTPQDSSDPHDLLLGQSYPDLRAQLDLWTNLSFDSEEPLAPRLDEHKKPPPEEEEDEDVRSPITSEMAPQDSHVNVGSIQGTHHTSPLPGNIFDINNFLAGFGIDSFPAHSSQPQQLPTTIAPSLAQLLALHPAHNASYISGLPQYTPPTASSYLHTSTSAAEESFVPAKRARSRKQSVTSAESPDYREDSMPPTTLSPTEDKRRRNTAASARFRLKKKEREAALEGKAKELETKVTELERECEGLRRENGWLKGLVVGVTGAAQGPNSNHAPTVPSPPPRPISAGTKRSREESA
ncbi:hypothetical protein GALMADRAFT_279895 [Galerina marginata CBS 339.88]|uniref:BZIP domain-containing protein n=1 Tax=Galerina marginata (strain CBS 339.88) TaxID=685588 RepID=A0A067SW25_GALM3|nr:hypothetical protein GALMADRAFT_279895 [Galerina marginata CBS 339.88]